MIIYKITSVVPINYFHISIIKKLKFIKRVIDSMNRINRYVSKQIDHCFRYDHFRYETHSYLTYINIQLYQLSLISIRKLGYDFLNLLFDVL